MTQSQPPRTGGENQSMSMMQEVGQTAREHTRELGEEVAQQARKVTGQVRERLGDEVHSQNDRLATTLRHLSEELETMGKNASPDSMAAAMVQRLSEGSRQAADYLREHGPDGVLHEVQEFARRKPGTFLLTSAVAGFVVGRLGKGLLTGNGNGSSHSNSNGNGNGNGYSNGYGTRRNVAGEAPKMATQSGPPPAGTTYVSGAPGPTTPSPTTPAGGPAMPTVGPTSPTTRPMTDRDLP